MRCPRFGMRADVRKGRVCLLKYPFMLLDDTSLSKLLGHGTYKFVDLTFDEASAIMNLHSEEDMICCLTNNAIEDIIYDYLGIDKKNFEHKEPALMEVGQDGLVFRLYETPSETQPVIRTAYGNEAKKIKNMYVYCELVSRTE